MTRKLNIVGSFEVGDQLKYLNSVITESSQTYKDVNSEE